MASSEPQPPHGAQRTGTTRAAGRRALEQAEFVELLERYRATGDRRARNQVVEAHMDIAEFQVRRFARGATASADDLRQTALMAIIHAADRFETGHGATFRTFATRTIEGELKRYLRDRTWAVRPPRGRQEMHLDVARCTEELSHELRRAPTVAEVAARLDVDPESVLEGMEAGRARQAEHIDPSPIDEDERGHILGALDGSYDTSESHLDLRAAVSELDERERRVLYLRFMEERSQPEIAELLGLSQSYVSRLLRSSLTQLRSSMSSDRSVFD